MASVEFSKIINEPRNFFAPLTLTLGSIWIALALMAVVTFGGPDKLWVRLWAPGYENSIATWFSILQLAIAGFLAFTTGWQLCAVDRLVSWGWMAAGVILFAMSADEQLMVHEHVGSWISGRFSPTGFFLFAWVIPGIALVVCTAALGIPFLRRLPNQTRWQLRAAAVVFVVGAIGMEMTAAKIASSHSGDLVFSVVDLAEELLEMMGVLIAIDAILRYRARLALRTEI